MAETTGVAVIEPRENGPLRVQGVKEFRNSRGEAITTEETFFLCRCGASQNKPFCDGTHKKIGITARAFPHMRPRSKTMPAGRSRYTTTVRSVRTRGTVPTVRPTCSG